jgi:hypothetical protein
VVDVGDVRVRVHDRCVHMPVGVRLARIDSRRMLMLVLLVVHMPVLVRERFVRMLVRVPIGEHADSAERHQHERDAGHNGEQLTERQRDDDASECAVANSAASRAAPMSHSAYASRMLTP